MFQQVASVLLLVILPLFAGSQPYRNLALEGGGIRGIAYCGALEVLEARGILDSIQNVSGTSVGAVAGVLISVGYRPAELREIMSELRLQSFNDGRWAFIGGQARLRRQFGWYRGDALERWIESKIRAKTGKAHLSFAGLHLLHLADPEVKDLYVGATNLSRQRGEVFSWKTRPDMELATAVRASMSIPLYFRAVKLDGSGARSERGDVYVDGGLVLNYPLAAFDSAGPNRHSLGLKLERPEQLEGFDSSSEIAGFRISNFRDYVAALYNLSMETLNRKGDMADEMRRTIYISTEHVAPRVRRLSTEQKNILYQAGYSAAERFFRKN